MKIVIAGGGSGKSQMIVSDLPPPTIAELLIDLARAIKAGNGPLITDIPKDADGARLARAAFALRFYETTRLHLPAIVEGWDYDRIKREVY